jgi:hypothetical protein
VTFGRLAVTYTLASAQDHGEWGFDFIMSALTPKELRKVANCRKYCSK